MSSGTPELTETEAVRQAQHGDAAAFEFLYKKHSKRVFNICLRMLRNTFDAEDMTQQIFLRVFRKVGTFRGDSAFSTWLHRVTVNTVLMHLRRKEPIESSPGGPGGVGECDDNPRGFATRHTSMLGPIDRLNLLRAILSCRPGTKDLSCFMTLWGMSTAKLRTSLVAL